MKLSGWGRYPVLEARTHAPRSVDALRELVLSEPSLIARGNGRAYGDSAINISATVETRHLNRMLAFHPVSGQLVAEAGVLLGDIISAFLSRGWFPMVTPGTKFVTLGGAIAADVHGKNHHKDGSFRACVDWIDVMMPDGEIHRCSRQDDAALFDHTLGGMGLTGIILRAAIRLRPVETAWIRQTTIAAPNLKAAMAAFEATQDATYSVAWIDCLGTNSNLGRSLVMLGEHATRNDLSPQQAQAPFQIKPKRRFTVPIDFPAFTLNSLAMRGFNALYYWAGARKTGAQLVDWDSYFYPLDAILGWNRIYGRKGFAQFQCALPLDRSETGLTALLAEIAKAGSGSFLAVLKRFGKQESAFSFPMEGYTLALDFPVTPRTLALLDRLDQIMIDYGGRIYLAKDSRMSSATLRASDPRVSDFHAHRNSQGFTSRFRSAQSERLAL
ncbi:FAD-binding oxidoreductase [Hoeflea sp.]|uniref:FAD-binding oxidoreductase n=1 Tax=Hoeflea sp. TaxID=1940281 RepID=UPI00199710D9|nr:FAD-binding oxidoreductase [Hoeflea sp.]MBC7285974.1 FAD-binding oxidoreductase [Hoeflea sp.]